jgi:hypothetical protein
MPEHAGTRLPGRSLAQIVGKRALLRTQRLQNGLRPLTKRDPDLEQLRRNPALNAYRC